ncbi:uncharacterized protein LOC111042691 [Myzus persicae]|uniref:uncharacterized protein LOC111042691 n=1 Tax=Myzus persicae TaxID=13164 RepID=UPI000B939405|nr:uncharacterized protein LOC111042691 [Myzus persicae]XP_022183074.1 uncharacterized protein LOC111042691 [Myzus persicae]
MFMVIKGAALRNGLVFNPKTFLIDFEIGMIVSIRETFGYETSIKGCLFHLGQAIWRKVQYLGLIHDCNQNGEIKKTVRRICSLALVPKDQIDYCWIEIHAQAPEHEGLNRLMSYFVETYLDTDVCIFNRSIWNHYETDHTRTINHLEGWHAALNRTISRPHPNIFILIKELKTSSKILSLIFCLKKNVVELQK